MKLLELEKLTVGYGRQPILNNVSLQVAEGEIVAIFGGNGSGKSTLLRCVFGLLKPTAGCIWFGEKDVTAASMLIRQRTGMSYLFQGRRVFEDMTVAENIEISGHRTARKTILDKASEMLEHFSSVKFELGRKAKELSGGEAKILACICAILSRPRLLLLDEPTASLSAEAAQSLLDLLMACKQRDGISMLMVAHNHEEAMRISSRALSITNGSVSELDFSNAANLNSAQVK